MKMFSTFIVASILSYATTASADIVLQVGATNPNGAPTTSGNQFLIEFVISDGQTDVLTAENLSVSDAAQVLAPTTGGLALLLDPNNVHLQTEATTANAIDVTYANQNDSYWHNSAAATGWKTTISDPSGGLSSMNWSFAEWGGLGVKIGNGAYDFAYVTVPAGEEVALSGTFLRGADPATETSFNYSLDSSGTLTAVPEPSAFLFLGLLGVVQGVRVWRQKRSAAPAVAA